MNSITELLSYLSIQTAKRSPGILATCLPSVISNLIHSFTFTVNLCHHKLGLPCAGYCAVKVGSLSGKGFALRGIWESNSEPTISTKEAHGANHITIEETVTEKKECISCQRARIQRR